MALTDIVERVKDLLYSSSVGEKPPLRIASSSAAESVSGPLLTFNVASNEGQEIKAGDILSVRSASGLATAFVLYVTSISTDAITCVNGYVGTDVAGADSGELDNAVLEQNAPSSATEYAIIKSIEAVFDGLLYPHVFIMGTETITPDLAILQSEVPATTEKVRTAYQEIANVVQAIPVDLEKDLHTTLSSTGKLVQYGASDGSTVYLTVEKRYLSSDTLPEDVEACVATGSAALAMGGDVAAANMARASKDSQRRGERDITNTLWRDFLTMRQAISERLSEDVEYFEISRG